VPVARTDGAATADGVDVEPLRDVLPPEYPPPSARASLAIAGAAIFAGWYAGSVGASLLWSDYAGAKDLRIPVVGPWLSFQHVGCADDDPDCQTSTVVIRVVATILDGVGQVGGLAAIGEAVFLPTAPAGEDRPKPPRGFVQATPFVAGRDAIGLGVRGAF